MKTREVAVVAVVVLLGVAGVALPTVAATTADAAVQANETNATATDANATADERDNESAAFGDQMTAFMQSSASETNDTVESGMWTAGFERANESEQARMARDRTGELEQRLERLQERNRTLTERYENGSINRSEYIARSSELSGRIAGLRTSINDTDRATEKAGVNETRLDTLRNDARNMTGPETAGVARDVVAGGQGPPADRGPRVDDGPGNEAGPGNQTTNATTGNGNDGGPGESSDGADASDGGENANPSDGGVGTGSNGDDSGETSSGDGTDANRSDEDDADSADTDENDESGDGANPGNGNGGSGNGNGGNDAGNGASDP